MAEHLAELVELTGEIGATGVWFIRGARDTRLIYASSGGDRPITVDIAAAGVLCLIRFPATDGGEPGLEVKGLTSPRPGEASEGGGWDR